ncbi:MAG: GxxExxY protein [Chloroflexota bacterium]
MKATRALVKDHEAQLLNYLKATPYEVGLLLNFGPHPATNAKRSVITTNQPCQKTKISVIRVNQRPIPLESITCISQISQKLSTNRQTNQQGIRPFPPHLANPGTN